MASKTSSVPESFKRAAAAAGLTGGLARRVVVACSGGADSSCLLHLMVQLGRTEGFEVVPVHVDHLIRSGSSRDAAMTAAAIKDRYGIATAVLAVDVPRLASSKGLGIEEAARMARRLCLESIRSSVDACCVALGHHRDDQAETLLFRLARGSGLHGAGCMRPLDGSIVRPLLDIPSSDIRAYLREQGISWIEDETNRDVCFSRNRIRHAVLPELSAVNEGAAAHLAAFAGEMASLARWVEGENQERLAQAIICRDDQLVVCSHDMFVDGPDVLVRERLRALYAEVHGGLSGIDRSHVDGFLAAIRMRRVVRMSFPGGLVFSRGYGFLLVYRRRFGLEPYVLDLQPGEIELPHELGAIGIEGPCGRAWRVRSPMPGDRVGNGKLHRLLQEHGVPVELRPLVPLVAEGSQVRYCPLIDGDVKDVEDARISFRPGGKYCKIFYSLHKRHRKE